MIIISTCIDCAFLIIDSQAPCLSCVVPLHYLLLLACCNDPSEPVTHNFLFGSTPNAIISSVCPSVYVVRPAPIYLCFNVLAFITIPIAAAQYTISSGFLPQNMFCLESYTLNPFINERVSFLFGTSELFADSIFYLKSTVCWSY